ncbi:MAG: ATP-dependent RNA helicase DbpA [Pseudomonadota bacterium]
MQNFNELITEPRLLQAIEVLGFSESTEIQAQALPVMLADQDILAQAKTGSGKTVAFSLALLFKLKPDLSRLQSLVLCPTRELADQVAKEIRAVARFIPNIKVLSLCGGIPVHTQLTSLVHEPHIIVGTPGRIQDLLNKQALKFDALQTVILDEADRMLDMGFLDSVKNILQQTPSHRKTWLFSATYPEAILEISKEFQNDPVKIHTTSQHDNSVIQQQFYKVEIQDKEQAVIKLLIKFQPERCLIFCNTKIDVKDVTDRLWKLGVPALELQGDLEQRDRDETLVQFANGSCRVMVATDVAARGLDIKSLPMVVLFELSEDAELHVHRIGRTGRAGETGLACCLVAPSEMGRLTKIEQANEYVINWKNLPKENTQENLPKALMKTLVIDAGRQDKLRPGDILGALTGACELSATDIGKIDIFPTRSYVAISQTLIAGTLKKLQSENIKGRKFRIHSLK